MTTETKQQPRLFLEIPDSHRNLPTFPEDQAKAEQYSDVAGPLFQSAIAFILKARVCKDIRGGAEVTINIGPFPYSHRISVTDQSRRPKDTKVFCVTLDNDYLPAEVRQLVTGADDVEKWQRHRGY